MFQLKAATCEFRHNWHKLLPLAVSNHNTTYHASLCSDPSRVSHVIYYITTLKYKYRHSYTDPYRHIQQILQPTILVSKFNDLLILYINKCIAHRTLLKQERQNLIVLLYNLAPLMIQIPPHEGSSNIPQLNGGPSPVSNPNFPFK